MGGCRGEHPDFILPFDSGNIALAENDSGIQAVGCTPRIRAGFDEMDVELVAGSNTGEQVAVAP